MKQRPMPDDDDDALTPTTADDVLDVLRETARLVADVELVLADHEFLETPLFSKVFILQALRQVLAERMREALEYNAARVEPFCVLLVETLEQVLAPHRPS